MSIDAQFEQLRADLHANYGHRYAAEDIDAKLDEAIACHKANAKVQDFIPILVERELTEFFGARRYHVRFYAGENRQLATLAEELTIKHAGDMVKVDTFRPHDLDAAESMADMPDFIVFLGEEVPHDVAGHDVKIWSLHPVETVDDARARADDIEYRVLYMLGRLGVEPISGAEVPTIQPDSAERVLS